MKHLVIILSIFTIAIGADTKIGGTTYFDYTSGDEKSAFNFKRQYLSFSGKASDDIQYKIVLDVGNTKVGTVLSDTDDDNDGALDEVNEDTRLDAFLKKAQLDYKASFGKVSMGMIGMNTYGVQEKNWGYRFIAKSAIDKNGYSSTADIGVGLSKMVNDDMYISMQVVNGEGYKKPQGDKHHKISINGTYGERKLNKNDGYNVGLVYSTEASDTDPTNMMSVFGGYATNGLRVGAEYNTNTTGNYSESLISLCANYKLKDDLDAYFRYDMDAGDADSSTDGDNYLIAGVVFNCGSGLLIAPNLQMTSYNDSREASSEYKVNILFNF